MATRKKILEDVVVTLEPPAYIYRYCAGNKELLVSELKQWARDIEDFIRDHRSQDKIGIEVERVYRTVCSECGDDCGFAGNECDNCGHEFED